MNNLKLYEEFSKSIYEGVTPVYDEAKFKKNVNVKPEMELKYSEVIPKLRDMLAQKEAGQIESITVIAEVPTQGKGAPDYVKDIIAGERERLARQYKSTIGKSLDTDVNADEFDFDLNRFGDKRTIFFDSEFIVDRIETIDGTDYVIGIPASLKDKGYEAKILPIKVEEIYFEPAGE
jgi:hypothetical protein